MFPGNPERQTFPGPRGYEDAVVGLQLLPFHIFAHAAVGPGFHAQGQDQVDLLVQDIFGQPVGGNPVAQHSSQPGKGLEEGDPVTQRGQVIGAGKAGRAGPDDRHLFIFLLPGGRKTFPPLEGKVADETLQGVYGRGFIILLAVAGSFAGMEADAPANPGKGVFPGDSFPGTDIVSLSGQYHSGLHVFARRTSFIAGGQLVHVGWGEVTPGPGLHGQRPIKREGHGGEGRLGLNRFLGPDPRFF